MVKIDPKAGMWTIDNTLLPQLRMQALDIVARGNQPVYKVFDIADQIVHYCLTGKHQLPEEK